VPHLLLLTTIAVIEMAIMDITMAIIAIKIHMEDVTAGMNEGGDPGMLSTGLNTGKLENCHQDM